jgi:CRP/FNR family cyclic AMP-dependent transcriptional regulator
MMPTDTDWLRQTDIFHGLSDVQLEMIASISQERRCRKGEIIFDENSASDEMYVVLLGRIEIQLNPSLTDGAESDSRNNMISIATMEQGQLFGEIALVDQGLRSAAARCAEDGTRLLIVPRDKLMMLCSSFPDLGFRLMYNLAAELALKLRNTDLAIQGQLLLGSGR